MSQSIKYKFFSHSLRRSTPNFSFSEHLLQTRYKNFTKTHLLQVSNLTTLKAVSDNTFAFEMAEPFSNQSTMPETKAEVTEPLTSPKEIGGRDCFFDLEESTSPYVPPTKPPKLETPKPYRTPENLLSESQDPFWDSGKANPACYQPSWFHKKPISMTKKLRYEDPRYYRSVEPMGGRDIFLDVNNDTKTPPPEQPSHPKRQVPREGRSETPKPKQYPSDNDIANAKRNCISIFNTLDYWRTQFSSDEDSTIRTAIEKIMAMIREELGGQHPTVFDWASLQTCAGKHEDKTEKERVVQLWTDEDYMMDMFEFLDLDLADPNHLPLIQDHVIGWEELRQYDKRPPWYQPKI